LEGELPRERASVFKNFVTLINRRAPMEEQTPSGKNAIITPRHFIRC
jgi:hypothetical protein